VYQLADAKLVGQFRAPGPIRSLAFSPNNLTLAGACQDKSLLAWNVAYNPGQAVPAEFGKLVATYAHAAAVTDVAFAPDSIQFYSSGQDKTIKAWRFASDAPIKSFAHPDCRSSGHESTFAHLLRGLESGRQADPLCQLRSKSEALGREQWRLGARAQAV
jgi:WD40 repeat protein